MYQKLVSHNDDIRRLVEKGYAIAFDSDSNCLIVRDIPYLDSNRELKYGAIVAKLMFTDENHVVQDDHQVLFAGSAPCGLDGDPIPNLGGGPIQLQLSECSNDVVVERSFSNKPVKTGKFEDFFEKIESYTIIICGPATERFGVTPYTFRTVKSSLPDSVFSFPDTLSSRAEIVDLSSKFKDDVVAIIGLGGTGSYVLDYLVNTPVKEIRAFDTDQFYVHNSYRSPGRTIKEEFNQKKTEVYRLRYESFRSGLNFLDKFVDSTSSEELAGVTFAFVCVDKGSSRSEIFKVLLSKKIPFVDVGMGLKRKGDALSGMIRTTFYPAEHGEEVLVKGFSGVTDNPNDIYKTNIQIAELNALNASLAIIKYKQYRGFYLDESPYHALFRISDLKIVGKTKI